VTEIREDWYDGFFESEWLDYLALGSSPEWTERTVAFLVEKLDLREGTRVLDIPCGRGRVAIPLAKHGCRVTGIDLSPRSLEIARCDAEAARVDLSLVRADMREVETVEAFDVALNLYSSIGYFPEEAEDERVLAGIARALVPGGTLMIDTINPVTLAPRFREREWRELADGATLLERRDWDQLRGRMNTRWSFLKSDGSRSESAFSMRMYTAPELVAMLGRATLMVDGAWGDWAGADLAGGQRIILRARK
jgi:SAM-dependent methyltransferase